MCSSALKTLRFYAKLYLIPFHTNPDTYRFLVGAQKKLIGVNLRLKGRLETARQVLLPKGDAARTSRRSRPTHWLVYTGKTHLRGLRNLDLTLVRAGGLRLCSREFYSPRLKLTRMSIAVPLPTYLYHY